VSANTGLLTSRCDPFGAESRIQMLGGLYDERHRGQYMWHCAEPAIGRYRMICTGGDYGFRGANDGGIVSASHCDGGHQGQVMALCEVHVAEFSVGPPKPGWSKDMRTPHGQVGGTKANEMCPACAFPPEARALTETANALQQQMAQYQAYGLMSEFARVQGQQDQIRARLDELHQTGRVHKCPLILREVS